MKEDLNITGNQYTYMTTIYNAVSQSSGSLLRPPPSLPHLTLSSGSSLSMQ
jgi:hypothetical protein